MAIELKMAALSPTMEKGTLAKWLVAVGDVVKPGDLLAEVETDKATMEVEAYEAGRVTRLLVADGTENVAVGTVIALLSDDADIGAELEPVGPPVAAAPSPAPAIVPDAAAQFTPLPEPGGMRITPLSRRIAAIQGIDLAMITGSGPHGRIIKADLARFLPQRADAASSQPPPPAVTAATPPASFAPPPIGVPVETIKLGAMRKTIARRLTEAVQTVPQFHLTVRCNLDPLLALRQELNAALADQGVKLSVNDLLLKAMALALRQVPEANVQFGGDVLHRFGRADIAMAVAMDGGLVTPVLRGVDDLSLSQIARTSAALADKARSGHLLPEECQGGTASLSNMGMYGVDGMVPIINLPQALILGVAAGALVPWNVSGAMALATVMEATGSFDHRAMDGADGGRFMAAFRELVEAPLRLVC